MAGKWISRCPKCGYEQHCPCKSCVENFPTDKKRWIWRGDLIECANCGFTAHVDKWEEIEMLEFRKVSTEFNKIKDLNSSTVL